MQELFAPALLELGRETGRIPASLQLSDQTLPINPTIAANNKRIMADHAETFRSLGFQMCAMKADGIVGALETGMTIGQYSGALNELYERMCDESRLFCMLSLTAQESAIYQPKAALFGADFEAKFPSGSYELDEGSKCLALGRSTAAVFHFMRLLEIAIQAVARSLQIPDPIKPAERNWGAILKSIWNGIEKKWPTTTARAGGDGRVFEDIYASLDAVKNPWRNATMHVENKYTGEEADHVFAAVRGFMRKLASRMDENGEPKA